MARPPEKRRRRFLQIAGTAAAVGITGCMHTDGEEEPGENETDGTDDGEDGEGGEEEEELPEGVSEEEFESGPVPEEYMGALSLGGEGRVEDPATNESVGFVEYEEATENEGHEAGQACANCADFIPDKDGDGFGACAEVEGYIAVEDWCNVWEGLGEHET